MIIPTDHLKNVCKIGQGAACCRYALAGADGIECGKQYPDLVATIDRRVAAGTFRAQGDNCQGLIEP